MTRRKSYLSLQIFGQITNELNYAVQGNLYRSIERRLRFNIEGREGLNKHLLSFKNEIKVRLRLLKSNTLAEVQNYVIETEMWLKESQPSKSAPSQPNRRFRPGTSITPKPSANTTAEV